MSSMPVTGSAPISIAGDTALKGFMRSPPSASPPSGSPPPGVGSGSFQKRQVSWPGSVSQSMPTSTGRYESDFDELEWLGRGGFGEVVKARNKLDGRVYAVKKIKLSEENKTANGKILREVTTLSRLNHDHVVRYYQAWIEEHIVLDPSEHDAINRRKSSGGESESNNTRGGRCSISIATPKLTAKSPRSAERAISLDQLLEKTLNANVLSSPSNTVTNGQMGLWGGDEDVVFATEAGDGDGGDVRIHRASDILLESGTSTDGGGEDDCANYRLYLFIQMEYCEGTLREAIDKCTLGDENTKWKTFRQVLEGLQYVHSKKIIHRDLTPSNIFFDSNGNAKIGDFGLATNLSTVKRDGSLEFFLEGGEMDSEDIEEGSNSISMSGVVGKLMYTPAKGDQVESDKLDIYSLGVVFFELWSDFSTRMERIIVLQRLRDAAKPNDEFTEAFPKQSALIAMMLEESDIKRPAAKEILKNDLLPPPLERDHIQDALRTIKQTLALPGYYSRLFGTILQAQDAEAAKDTASDTSPLYRCTDELVVSDRVIAAAASVFRCHDAISLRLPSIQPPQTSSESGHQNDPSSVYILTEGSHVSPLLLENDARVSVARYISSSRVTKLRCFDVVDEYAKAKDSPVPARQTSCVFDIVGESPLRAMAELIGATHEVFVSLSQLPSEGAIFQVSHTGFLPALLELCELNQTSLKKASEILAEIGTVSWMQIRRRLLLSNIMSAPQADRLGSMLSVDGPALKVLDRLRKHLEPSSGGVAAVEEVSALVRCLDKVYGVARVRVDVASSCHKSYFDGLVFKAYVNGPEQDTMMAYGGSYGSLLAKMGFCRQSAVGTTIMLDEVVRHICSVERRRRSSKITVEDYTTKMLRQVDVCVCCEAGGDTEDSAAYIAAQLRKAKLVVAYSGPSNQPLREQLNSASRVGAEWTLYVDEKGTEKKTIIARRTHHNSTIEIPISEVVRRISECKLQQLYPAVARPLMADGLRDVAKMKASSSPALNPDACSAGRKAASSLSRAFKFGVSPAPVKLARGNSAQSGLGSSSSISNDAFPPSLLK